VTRDGARRTRTTGAAASLLAALAATGVADVTYASTVAAAEAPPTRRTDPEAVAPTARLAAVVGVGGAIVDSLWMDFASPRGVPVRPFVVWTGAQSSRLDLSNFAWTADRAAARRAAAPAESDGTPLARYLAEMAWSAGVADQVPRLTDAAPAASLDFFVDAVSAPEPGAAALFALGATGLVALAWTRRRRAKSG